MLKQLEASDAAVKKFVIKISDACEGELVPLEAEAQPPRGPSRSR